jgi:hypothetical protein
MAIKTFTTGEVLTAANTNEFLANSGLVYVTSAVVGSGVSTITFNNCFSSTYDAYKIVYSGGKTSANGSISLKLRKSGTNSDTGYYGLLIYGSPTGPTIQPAGNDNSVGFTWAGGSEGNTAGYAQVMLDLNFPFGTGYTAISNATVIYSGVLGSYNGMHKVNDSYDGFQLYNLTFTGGTVTVYGYRKA